MKKIFAVIVCVAFSIMASATPFKNVWATLETATTGAGTVYMTCDDPNPKKESETGVTTEIQCTLTESNGGYPVTLHAIPEEGWTFIGFTNILREDGNYQNSDFVSRDNPAKVFITIDRTTETAVAIDASETELERTRNVARQKEPWPDEPDARFYAVFVQKSDKKMLTGLIRYAVCQQPDGSGAMGTIEHPEVIFEGDEVTAVGKPRQGCSFVKWTDDAGKTVTTNPNLTFTAEEGVAYTAHFKMDAVEVGPTLTRTFSATKAVDLQGRQDIKAYSLVWTWRDELSPRQVDFIPHGAGVLLRSEASGNFDFCTDVTESDEFHFLSQTEPSFYSNNLLKGCGDKEVEADGTLYVLADKSQGLGFYRLKRGEKVPAGKAYLSIVDKNFDFIPLKQPQDAREQTTLKVTTIKHSAHGEMSELYNLKGQKVNSNYKGLVISKMK